MDNIILNWYEYMLYLPILAFCIYILYLSVKTILLLRKNAIKNMNKVIPQIEVEIDSKNKIPNEVKFAADTLLLQLGINKKVCGLSISGNSINISLEDKKDEI